PSEPIRRVPRLLGEPAVIRARTQQPLAQDIIRFEIRRGERLVRLLVRDLVRLAEPAHHGVARLTCGRHRQLEVLAWPHAHSLASGSAYSVTSSAPAPSLARGALSSTQRMRSHQLTQRRGAAEEVAGPGCVRRDSERSSPGSTFTCCMWFLPVGSTLIPLRSVPALIPLRSVPDEAGSTPRAPARPDQTTPSRGPKTRREVSAARKNQSTPPSPPPPPRPFQENLRVLRVFYEKARCVKGQRGGPSRPPVGTRPGPLFYSHSSRAPRSWGAGASWGPFV